MEQFIKAFLAVFLMLLLTFAGVGILSASLDASHAEKFASKVADTIEASNYSEKVIENCKQKSEEAGYKSITISVKDSNKDGYNDMAEVVVGYDYTIGFFNTTGKTHYARAYAR